MFNPPPTPPIEHFFGRNSVPPGSFREIFGSSELGEHFCTTATSDGSASCGRNSRFTGFMGSGGLREITRPRPGPETGQKRQKVDFPGLGGRSG